MTPITPTAYRALPPDDQNALVAEHVMGRDLADVYLYNTQTKHEDSVLVMVEDGKDRIVPAFTRDLNVCQSFQAVLKEKKKWRPYTAFLRDILYKSNPSSLGDDNTLIFLGATATASQKCEAALLAVGAVVEEKGEEV